MDYFYAILIGYMLGSIPSAYLWVKYFKNIDITQNGSGNVGALNSLEVSKSKFVALLVLASDFLKGALDVVLVKYFINDTFLIISLSSAFAVFAHCYTPWLKFKGGRGLATAAGAFLFSVPFVALVWMFIWLVSFLIKKNVHFGNLAATIITPIIVLFYSDFIGSVSFVNLEPTSNFLTISVLIFMIIIFSKHIEPLKVLINQGTSSRRRK